MQIHRAIHNVRDSKIYIYIYIYIFVDTLKVFGSGTDVVNTSARYSNDVAASGAKRTIGQPLLFGTLLETLLDVARDFLLDIRQHRGHVRPPLFGVDGRAERPREFPALRRRHGPVVTRRRSLPFVRSRPVERRRGRVRQP